MRNGFVVDASNPEKAIRIGERIWWVGHVLEGDPFQCHVYLIENGDQSVLIDPGSLLTFPYCLQKIEEIIPFEHIRYFICHHQDPDITASLPMIDSRVRRDDAVIVSHWRAIALIKHYGLRMPFLCVEKSGWRLDIGGRELEFIFTPYLHFAGAFCTLDRRTGTLFSSDLFGGFTEKWELVARDEGYFESIREFHQHYMPSHDILFAGLSKIEHLPLNLIAPQHGSMVPAPLIPPIISRLKEIDCGLFLMAQTSTNIKRLCALHTISRGCLDALLLSKDFTTIAGQFFSQIRKIFPAESVDFYARRDEHELSKFGSGSSFREESAVLPDTYVAMLGQDHGAWSRTFGEEIFEHGLIVDHCPELAEEIHPACNHLIVPLSHHDQDRIDQLMVFCFELDCPLDLEIRRLLVQVSQPLGVALEREVILRVLEREGHALYEQAIRDPLTNLFTRLYMREAVNRLFSINDRDPRESIGVIALDLDHFKEVNDTYGHAAGDQALKLLATIMMAETRDGDIQVRLGGDEFLIFVVCEDPEVSARIAERIRVRIAEATFDGDLARVRLSVSCGVVIREPREGVLDLLKRADQALYRAKHQGKNEVCADLARCAAARAGKSTHPPLSPGP